MLHVQPKEDKVMWSRFLLRTHCTYRQKLIITDLAAKRFVRRGEVQTKAPQE